MSRADKEQSSGTTRRTHLKHLALALLALPLLRLGETVARADKRRRRHRGAGAEDLWIGHC